jgi:hypothetical protein
MASPGQSDPREVHRSWQPDEQFSDVILIDDNVGLQADGADVRTCLLVNGSSNDRAHSVATGMVLALGRIRRADRDAVVGFLPSLEHAAQLAHFGSALTRAYGVASDHPKRLVVAGSLPDGGTVAAEALVVNAFGRFPHISAAGPTPGRRDWRQASMTVGTVDAFRTALLTVEPGLAYMVDAIASSSSIRGEARILRDVAERSASLALPPFAAARARQACLVVPLTRR